MLQSGSRRRGLGYKRCFVIARPVFSFWCGLEKRPLVHGTAQPADLGRLCPILKKGPAYLGMLVIRSPFDMELRRTRLAYKSRKNGTGPCNRGNHIALQPGRRNGQHNTFSVTLLGRTASNNCLGGRKSEIDRWYASDCGIQVPCPGLACLGAYVVE